MGVLGGKEKVSQTRMAGIWPAQEDTVVSGKEEGRAAAGTADWISASPGESKEGRRCVFLV